MYANQTERTSLMEEMASVAEEAQIVIPGAQALFGFQTAVSPMPGLVRFPKPGN